MTRRHMARSLAILSLVCFLAQSLIAADYEGLSTGWSLTPETDRSHPSGVTLAIPVFRDMTVTRCDLRLRHSRIQIDLVAGEVELLALPKGGKMKVALEVARADGVTAVEKGAVKVKREERSGDREAFLAWVDPSGVADGPDERYHYVHSDSFPFTVESGDVLLFSVKFTKRPTILGVERTATHLRRDSIGLGAECHSCGSNDTPCEEL